MMPDTVDERLLKKAIKEVLLETLEERRELFLEIFEEVLQEYAIYPLSDDSDIESFRRGVMFTTIEGKA
ncbi:MAG: hypothetical protein ACOCSK_01375 [Rhodothermales bacterium]